MTKEEFNNEPVLYCKNCLSLRIMSDELIGDYCPDCGSTDIEECHIEEWLELKRKEEERNKYRRLL